MKPVSYYFPLAEPEHQEDYKESCGNTVYVALFKLNLNSIYAFFFFLQEPLI